MGFGDDEVAGLEAMIDTAWGYRAAMPVASCLLVILLGGSTAIHAQCMSPLETEIGEHLAAGRRHLARGAVVKAIGELEIANRLAEGECYEPLIVLAEARLAAGRHLEAGEAAQRAESVAPDPGLRAAARALHGEILLARFEASESPEAQTDLLKQAETLLRRALLFESSAPDHVRYMLAKSLDLQDEPKAAWAEYQQFLVRQPKGPLARDAQRRTRELRKHVFEDGAPFVIDDNIEPPVAIRRPRPPNPVRMKGLVIVQAVIDTEGRVTNVTLLKGLHPKLDKGAMKTFKRWRFRPARHKETGLPVAVFSRASATSRRTVCSWW